MDSTKSRFEAGGDENRTSTISEFLVMLKQNKKWWLLPILFVLLALALLAIFASTGAAPFIYTLF